MPAVQIRDVPDSVLETLKRRASEEGRSLSEYLRLELEQLAQTPTMSEVIERIRSRELYDFDVDAAEIIRQEREERDRQLDRR